jgi:hypothetical protein
VAEADPLVQLLPLQDLLLNKPVLLPLRHTLPQEPPQRQLPLLLLLLLLCKRSHKRQPVQVFSDKWPAQLRKFCLPCVCTGAASGNEY